MKRNKSIRKSSILRIPSIPSLLMFSLLLGGCSYYDHQFSYFNMMDDKKRTESNKQAAEKFWASVRPVSTLSNSHYRLGLHYQKQGEYEKAIKEFSKALHNDRTYCKAYNGIAMSYDALRRCEPAHASYDQALKCNPDQAYTYNNYACSSLLCGNYAKGVGLFLKAEKLADGNTRIKNNLRIAQTIVMREHISNFIPAKSLPEPVALLAPASSLPESEKTLTHTVDELSDSTEKTISDRMDMDDIQPDNTPAPVIGATGEKLDLLLPALAANHAEAVKLVAEKDKKIVLPVPTIPSLSPEKVAIEVSNGNGTTGMAGRSAGFLRGHGFTVRSITNAEHYRFEESIIFYKEEYLQVAQELAAIIPGAQNLKKVDAMAKKSIGVRVLLGRDLVTMRFPEGFSGIAGFPAQKSKHLLTSTISVSNNLVHY